MIERTFIQQGLRKIEIDEFLKKELIRAGFTKSEIVKTPMVTRIVIHVTRPGLAIGKSGSNIKMLTRAIEKKFKIDNPQMEIKEIEIPELDAQAQADKIKIMLEREFSWRSVSYRTVRDIMAAGAQGVELILSGKLAGKGGRKRKQRIAFGYMKKVGGQTNLVDYGKASAYPKAGAIGIKIRLIKPDVVFPDKVDFKKLFEDRRIIAEELAAKETSKKAESMKEAKEETKQEEPKATEKPAVKAPAKKTEAKAEKPEEKKETKPETKTEKAEEKQPAKTEKPAAEAEEPKKEAPKAEAPKAESMKEANEENKQEEPKATEKPAEKQPEKEEKKAEKQEAKPETKAEETAEKPEEKKEEAEKQ